MSLESLRLSGNLKKCHHLVIYCYTCSNSSLRERNWGEGPGFHLMEGKQCSQFAFTVVMIHKSAMNTELANT